MTEAMCGSRSTGCPVGSTPSTATSAASSRSRRARTCGTSAARSAARELERASPCRRRRRRSRCPRAGIAPATRRAAARGCACPGGSTARRSPSGPSALWAPSATRSAPSASTSRSTHGAAWTASTWSSTPRRARTTAATSAIGWIVPTSLFAEHHRTERRPVRDRALDVGGIDAPVPVDRHLDDLEAELLEVVERVADGMVLDRRRDDPVAARLAGPRGALEGEVAGLGPAAREHDLPRVARRSSGRAARGRRRGPRARAARTRAPRTGCRTCRRGTAASPRGPRGGAGVVAAWSRYTGIARRL